ncbi:MAG TPA: hypothetical protein VNK52_16090 [Hyphomicrobiaceae bacterium]|nr:hypothetical protein [Hyphomicrobiaceae bacterium]
MATGVATGTQARVHGSVGYAVHTLQKEVAYNTPDIGSGVGFDQWLPQNAEIIHTKVRITEAFNAGTTNVLTVGTNATSYDNLVDADDVNEGATGATTVSTGAALDLSAGPARPFVKYAQTGSAATAGRAVITIVYAPANR